MNTDKQNTENQESNLSFNWIEIFQNIFAIRKTIYKAASIGLVIGIILALYYPKKYTVTVTLSPEIGNNTNASGNLLSLASSFLGSNVNISSTDALNATLSQDIVSSTPFLLELFNIRVQDIDGENDTLLVNYIEQQNSWIGCTIKKLENFTKNIFLREIEDKSGLDPFQLKKSEYQIIKTLRKSITVNIDKITAITTISVTFQDAKVTAIVADSVVNKLQKYIIDYRQKKAKENYIFLEQLHQERQMEYYKLQEKYAKYVDANKNIVLQSTKTEQERLQNDMNLAYQVYSQIAQQLEIARTKIQESKPVFAIVEPATIPLQPSSISRKLIVLIAMLMTIFCTIFWTIWGKKYWAEFKRSIKSNNFK